MRFLKSVPLLIVFLFGLIAAYNNKISPHFFLLNVLVLLAFLYLNIYIHEYGHVIAARLVGIDVRAVIIGNGKALWRKTVFGIPLFVTNSIGVGFTLVGRIDKNLLKLRYAFFILGGVLSQLLLTIACFALFGTKDLAYLYAGGISISTMYIISNVLMILTNLFPFNINFYGLRIPNDGLKLLKIPFGKAQDLMDSDETRLFELIRSKIEKADNAIQNN